MPRSASANPRVRGRELYWCALWAFLAFPVLYQHGYRALAHPQPDFPTFYLAAHSALDTSGSPYDVDALRTMASEEGIEQHVFPFLYPPPSLVLLLPLGALSHRHAALMFMLLSHAALLVEVPLACA
jgi:hypothetical protein